MIFGRNEYNQCEIPRDVKQKKIQTIALGAEHSALLFEDGSAVIFGNNDDNQCEIPHDVKQKKIQTIALGENHSALL